MSIPAVLADRIEIVVGTPPKDVGVSLSLFPKEKKRISTLKLSLKKFRKVVDDHIGRCSTTSTIRKA